MMLIYIYVDLCVILESMISALVCVVYTACVLFFYVYF